MDSRWPNNPQAWWGQAQSKIQKRRGLREARLIEADGVLLVAWTLPRRATDGLGTPLLEHTPPCWLAAKLFEGFRPPNPHE
jgi:hypothetical protein